MAKDKNQREKNKAIGLSSAAAASRLTAVLPLAIGAGITGHSIYQQRGNFLTPFFSGTGSPSGPAQNILRSISSAANNPSFHDIGKQIRDLNVSTLGKSEVMSAWFQASKVFPDQALVANMTQQLVGISAPQDIVDAIAGHLGNSSIYSNRARGRFSSLIGSMVQHRTRFPGPITYHQRNVLPKELGKMSFGKLTAVGRQNLDTLVGSSAVAENLVKLQSQLEARSVSLRRLGHPGGLPGSTLEVTLRGGGVLGKETLKFQFAQAIKGQKGIVATGSTASAQFVSGLFTVFEGNKIGSTLAYDEWASRRAVESLGPKLRLSSSLTPSSIGRIASEFERELRQPLEHIIPAIGGRDPFAMQRAQAGGVRHMISGSGKLLGGEAIAGGADVLAAGGFYPLSPGSVAKGRLVTFNPAELTAFPQVASLGRRPGAGLRGFIPTPTTAASIAADPLSQRHAFLTGRAFREAGEEFRSPAGWTLFSSRPLVHRLGFEEGEALARKSWLRKRMRTMTTFEIPLLKTEGGVMGMLEEFASGRYQLKGGGTVASLIEGTHLGISPSNLPVEAGQGMEILGATAHGDIMKLQMRQRFGIENKPKVFRDLKEVLTEVPGGAMGEFDINAHIGNLKKQRSAHMKQMFSALTEFNYRNMKSMPTVQSLQAELIEVDRQLGKFPDSKLADLRGMLLNRIDEAEFRQELFARREYYYERIGRTYERVETLAPRMAGTREVGIRGMARLARRAGLTTGQAGEVFGAIPGIMGEGAAAGFVGPRGFRAEWLSEIGLGRALGVSHLAYGGPKSGLGIGRARAAIEPRVIEMLSSPAWGPAGQGVIEDLLTRRRAASPEALLANQELSRSLRSLAPGAGVATGGGRVYSLAQLTTSVLNPKSERWIGHAGGYVSFAGKGGLGNVYIPAQGQFAQMSIFRKIAGKEVNIFPELTRGYGEFLEAATLEGGAFSDAYKRFVAQLGGAEALTVTGKGGLARGEIQGSAFLQAITPDVAGRNIISEVGVGKDYGLQMLNEMKAIADTRRFASDKARRRYINILAEMTNAFKRGGRIPSYLQRQPTTGPRTIAPVLMFMDPTIPEGAGTISLPMVQKTIGYKGKPVTINWSLTPGLAADFDVDPLGIIPADPTQRAAVREMAQPGSAFYRRYEDWVIREQLMGVAKAPDVGGLSRLAQVSGDITKMAATEKIGLLSFEASKARAALLASNLPAETIADAMHVSELLEKHLISAKHIPVGQEKRFLAEVQDVIESFQNRKPEALAGHITEMIDPNRRELLAGNVTITEGGVERVIRGVDLPAATQGTTEALDAFGIKYGDQLSGLRAHYLRHGRSTMAPSEILSYLTAEGALPAGRMSGLGRAVQSNINELTAAGGKAIRHARPLAWGFGISMALAATLSSPVSTLEGGGKRADPYDINFGDRTAGPDRLPTDVFPRQPQPGMPMTPTAIPYGSSPVGISHGYAAHVNVRGRAMGTTDFDAIGSSLRRHIGPETTTNINLRDNRSQLNAQNIAGIINRY